MRVNAERIPRDVTARTDPRLLMILTENHTMLDPRDMRGMVGLARVAEDSGFDAVMFCNENDRPYELHAGLESAAAMGRVVAECKPAEIPFGVDFLWDAKCALAVGATSGASFIREVLTGSWESDMGAWNPDAAAVLRELVSHQQISEAEIIAHERRPAHLAGPGRGRAG